MFPAQGLLSDTWVYSVANNTWAYFAGRSTVNDGPVYGNLTVASANNMIGARRYPAVSFNNATGLLYMHGGFGFGPSNVLGILNGFWSFDVRTRLWTFLSGSMSSANVLPTFGALLNANSTNNPGSRDNAGSFCVGGRFFVFGGERQNTSTSTGSSILFKRKNKDY